MNEICVLTKENPKSSLVPSTIWGYNEKTAIYEPGSGISADTKFSGTLILDFQLLELRNRCLLFISHSFLGIFVAAV